MLVTGRKPKEHSANFFSSQLILRAREYFRAVQKVNACCYNTSKSCGFQVSASPSNSRTMIIESFRVGFIFRRGWKFKVHFSFQFLLLLFTLACEARYYSPCPRPRCLRRSSWGQAFPHRIRNLGRAPRYQSQEQKVAQALSRDGAPPAFWRRHTAVANDGLGFQSQPVLFYLSPNS